MNRKEFEYLSEDDQNKLNSVLDRNNIDIDEKLIEIFNDNVISLDIILLVLFTILEEEKVAKSEEEYKKMIPNIQEILNLDIVINEENDYEDYRNMIVIIAKDYRVIIAILILRLYSMNKKKKVEFENKKEYGEKTLNIFAPLAHRLGLGNLKANLEELSLYYIDIKNYKKVANLLQEKQDVRNEKLNFMLEEINQKLSDKIKDYSIKGRSKSIYSIYKKTIEVDKDFSQVYDFQGIRIICKTKEDCYTALGIVHENYLPISGRFKDYIALKKPNLYQSLHTGVTDKSGEVFEIQIRTFEMDMIAERGIAAHWIYKEENNKSLNDLEEQLHVFRDLLERNNTDEIDNLTKDIFESMIYTFTPSNKIIMLPVGATVIDFAYKIHTNIGQSIQTAIVNNRITTFDAELKNGDRINIITKKESNSPQKQWLDFVKTSHAKKKIKTYLNSLKNEEDEVIIKEQRVKLKKLFRDGKLNNDIVDDKEAIKLVKDKFSVKSIDTIYKEINCGNITISQLNNVFHQPKEKVKFKKIELHNNNNVHVQGIDNIKLNLAKCCKPIYGDDIVGVVNSGKHIAVHRKECQNIKSNQVVGVYWDKDNNTKYIASLKLISLDRQELLNDIISLFSKNNVFLGDTKSQIKDELVYTNVDVYVSDKDNLEKIINSLKNITGVKSVKRE